MKLITAAAALSIAAVTTVSIGIAAEPKPSENKPQIIVAARRNSAHVGGTCNVGLRVINGTTQIIDRLSARFELVNVVLGAPYAGAPLAQFTVELVPSLGSRSADAFVDTWCDEHSSIRVVRIDFCQVGGRIFSDCGDYIKGSTAAETKDVSGMAVTYVPLSQ